MKSLLVILVLAATNPESVRTLSGKATSLQGEALYELVQKETWRSGRWSQRSVSGRLMDGREVFSQEITPGVTPAVPNITMRYNNSSKGFSVKWVNGGVVMRHTDENGKTTENTLSSPPKHLVGPGGIVAAIRAGWHELTSGKTLQWSMVIPPKANAYSVRLVPQGIEKLGGREAFKVTLEADSWLVRLLAPSTDFWIDTELKSTLRYRGPGATANRSGNPEEVFILFKAPLLPVVDPGH